MSSIPATTVKQLRDRTNLPFAECKKALEEAAGDMDKAIDILRIRNSKLAVKKGERETTEGRIAVFIDPKTPIAAILEMRCESAPVAKSEGFIQLANELVEHIANKNPATTEEFLAQPFFAKSDQTVTDRINETLGLIRENMKPARFRRFEATCGQYIHHDASVGVLLAVKGAAADPDFLREVCMHVAAFHIVPVATTREQVPQDIISKERELAVAKAQASGKPANIAEKIAEGQLNAWYKDNVLVEQPFIKDDSKTVGQVLKEKGFEVLDFVRYKVGEVEGGEEADADEA